MEPLQKRVNRSNGAIAVAARSMKEIPMRGGFVRAAAVLVAVLPTAAAAGDTVTLNFAWSESMVAEVVYSVKKTKLRGADEQVLTVDGTFKMTTTPAAEGLHIEFESTGITVNTKGAFAPAGFSIEEHLAKLMSSPSGIIVTHDGRFVRVEGLERLSAHMRSLSEELLRDMPADLQQKVGQVIDQALSGPALESMMYDDWNRDVEAWLNAELEQGERYEVETIQTIPVFGNAEVPTVVSFQFVGRVPCAAEEAESRCVELEIVSEPKSEQMADAIVAFVKRLAPSGAVMPPIQSFDMRTTVRIVTEPDSLLPHRVWQLKSNRITFKEGDKITQGGQDDETLTIYRY